MGWQTSNIVGIIEPHQRSKMVSPLLTLGEISIKVKGKNVAVKVVKAHSTITNPDFMEALQQMVNSMNSFVHLIY